jgi:thiosulfate reductase cytochrome b subunit
MTAATKRSILRWIHIVFGLTLVGFIYGPPEEVAPYRDIFRYIFMPAVIVTGLWLWKGEAIKRLLWKS